MSGPRPASPEVGSDPRDKVALGATTLDAPPAAPGISGLVERLETAGVKFTVYDWDERVFKPLEHDQVLGRLARGERLHIEVGQRESYQVDEPATLRQAAFFVLDDPPTGLEHPRAALALRNLARTGWTITNQDSASAGSDYVREYHRDGMGRRTPMQLYRMLILERESVSYSLAESPEGRWQRLYTPAEAGLLDYVCGAHAPETVPNPKVADSLADFLKETDSEVDSEAALRLAGAISQHYSGADAAREMRERTQLYSRLLKPQHEAGWLDARVMDQSLVCLGRPVEGQDFEHRTRLFLELVEGVKAGDLYGGEDLALNVGHFALSFYNRISANGLTRQAFAEEIHQAAALLSQLDFFALAGAYDDAQLQFGAVGTRAEDYREALLRAFESGGTAEAVAEEAQRLASPRPAPDPEWGELMNPAHEELSFARALRADLDAAGEHRLPGQTPQDSMENYARLASAMGTLSQFDRSPEIYRHFQEMHREGALKKANPVQSMLSLQGQILLCRDPDKALESLSRGTAAQASIRRTEDSVFIGSVRLKRREDPRQ